MLKNITLDIHGLTETQARNRVIKTIQKAPPGTDYILVIHGCNGGTVLRDMVRRLRGGRILEVTPSFANDGQTSVYLKK